MTLENLSSLFESLIADVDEKERFLNQNTWSQLDKMMSSLPKFRKLAGIGSDVNVIICWQILCDTWWMWSLCTYVMFRFSTIAIYLARTVWYAVKINHRNMGKWRASQLWLYIIWGISSIAFCVNKFKVVCLESHSLMILLKFFIFHIWIYHDRLTW